MDLGKKSKLKTKATTSIAKTNLKLETSDYLMDL